MHRHVLPKEGTHAVQQGHRSPAIVVLSSSLLVVHANRGGIAVLRELKGDGEDGSLQIPAPVLAYWADGILKDIAVRRMLRIYTPFLLSCSIEGPARIWYCQAFGFPSQDEIDRSRIVLLFSDNPPCAGATEERGLVPTYSSPSTPLSAPVPEASVV